MTSENTTVVSVRMSREMHKALVELAKKLDRPLNNQIRYMLQQLIPDTFPREEDGGV